MNIKNILRSGLMAALVLLTVSTAQATAFVNQVYVDRLNGSFAVVAPKYVLARSLAASTAEDITVPTGGTASNKANYVSFSSTCDFYANYSTTATVPGDTTDGTASELNPLMRYLGGEVTTISVITAASSCIVTASFYM